MENGGLHHPSIVGEAFDFHLDALAMWWYVLCSVFNAFSAELRPVSLASTRTRPGPTGCNRVTSSSYFDSGFFRKMEAVLWHQYSVVLI